MKTSSAKAKGRLLQQWMRDLIIVTLGLDPEDVKSTSMGAPGEDIQLSKAARVKFPYSVECKNVEKLNVWEAYEQAKSNCSVYEPVVFIKKNGKKPLAVVDAEHFVKLQAYFCRREEL